MKSIELFQRSGGVTSSSAQMAAEPGCPDRTSALDRSGRHIDQNQLASLREIQQPGKTDFVTELIDLFLRESSFHLKVLREAVTKGERDEIERMAHRLKGSSANMGVMQMAALCEQLESKDPAKDTRGLLVQLEEEFALVRELLKAERKETPGGI